MSKSTPSVTAPTLSAQELDLLQQQGITLQTVQRLLEQGETESEELQGIFKQFSGFFTTETTEAQPEREEFAFNPDIELDPLRTQPALFVETFGRRRGEVSEKAVSLTSRSTGIPPELLFEIGKVQSEAVKGGASFAQADTIGKQRLNEVVARAQQDPSIAQQFGLATKTTIPAVEAGTRQVLDPNAIADFKSRIDQQIQLEEGIQTSALQSLQDISDRLAGRAPKTPFEQSQERIGLLQSQRLEKALAGELPISESTIRTEADEFEKLKAGLAQRGEVIEGDTPSTAIARTTSGAQALQNFRERFGLLKDAERRGEIDAGSVINLQRLGFLSQERQQEFGQALSLSQFGGGRQQLGFLTGAPSATQNIPQLLALSQQFGGATQPFQQQRLFGFETGLASQQLRAQQRALPFTGLGLGAGIGSQFGLQGSLIGGGLGFLGGLLSR